MLHSCNEASPENINWWVLSFFFFLLQHRLERQAAQQDCRVLGRGQAVRQHHREQLDREEYRAHGKLFRSCQTFGKGVGLAIDIARMQFGVCYARIGCVVTVLKR